MNIRHKNDKGQIDWKRKAIECQSTIQTLQKEIEALKSELNKAEQQIHTTNSAIRLDEERMDLAAIGANIGIWDFFPQEGKIIANRTWVTQKKYDPTELRADNNTFSEVINGLELWSKLVHPDDLDKTMMLITEHLEGKSKVYRAEFRMKCSDGSWKWILDVGQIFEWDKDKKPLRMNGVHIDIDEIKHLEEKLKKAKEEAEAANQAKSAFLANMSHEIRTPLNAILGFSEIILLESNGPEKRYAQIINRSGNSLLELINNILDLSKVEAGMIELKYAPVSLITSINDLKSLFSKKILDKNLGFEIHIQEKLPELLLLDKVRIKQVITNILGNAIKFTKSGKIILNVNFEYPKKNKTNLLDLKVSISDTGIGIPEDQIDTIFDSFTQIKGQNPSEFEGTGLGLSISKKLTHLMGGKIIVKSKVGEGSTFIIQINEIEVISDKKTSKKSDKTFDTDSIHFESATVLVCDDIEYNIDLIISYLKNTKLQFIKASNGKEVLDLLNEQIPDIILLDMKMSVMDGYELSAILKRDKKYSKIPLVAVTASAMEKDQEVISQLCDKYLPKPINKTSLYKTLIEFLPYSKKNYG